MRKKINIRPTTSVYATYKNIKYEPWTAIAEFVDNSTQSYYDNKDKLCETKYWDGLNVEIEYERNVYGDRLVIRDNAFGMDFNDFKRAIMLDSPPKKATRSEFGMGLKTAACWFGKNWSVESTALGSNVKYSTTVDVEILHKYKNEEIEVEEIQCDPKEHGTIITIWNLNRTVVGRQVGKTKDQLRGMYRVDLRSGEIKISYNGENLYYEEPKVLEETLPDGSVKTWKKDISFTIEHNNQKYHVNGYIGLREQGSVSAAGFALIRRGRVILGGYENAYRPEEIFEKSNSFVYQRLFGELNLDDWPVTQTKDAFDWYSGLEDIFIEKLKYFCSDYIKKAKEYRKGKKVSTDKTINTLVDTFSKAGIINNATVTTISTDENRTNQINQNTDNETAKSNTRSNVVNVNDNTADIEIEGPTGKSITFTTKDATYTFNLILHQSDPLEQWLKITPVDNDKNTYNIQWNIKHPFFKPYIDEPDFLTVMEQFVFALALAEIEASKVSIDGTVPAGAVRMRMNTLLKDVVRGKN